MVEAKAKSEGEAKRSRDIMHLGPVDDIDKSSNPAPLMACSG